MPSCWRETPHTVPYCATSGAAPPATVSSHTCPSSSCSRAWEPHDGWQALSSLRSVRADEFHILHHMGTQQHDLFPAISPMRFRTVTRWLEVKHPPLARPAPKYPGRGQRLCQKQPLLHATDQPWMGVACRLREISRSSAQSIRRFRHPPAHAWRAMAREIAPR